MTEHELNPECSALESSTNHYATEDCTFDEHYSPNNS